MDFSLSQLDALVAIAESGSFEAAARQLHITPSAVSQRIRALEAAAGQVVVSRGTPCRPTPHGERLVQLGRQTRLLHAEAQETLGTLSSVDVAVAVNADSLATWFRDVLGDAAGWAATALLVHGEDQAHSQELLRQGAVLAAVTSEPVAVQGCALESLGTLRYVAAATPAFAGRWQQAGGLDWAAMPTLCFNDKDDLQRQQLQRRGVGELPPVVHWIPSAADFQEAIRLGLGWGMLPTLQAHADLASGRLVRLSEDIMDVPLHWQRWRLGSPRLTALTESVRRAARRHLYRPQP